MCTILNDLGASLICACLYAAQGPIETKEFMFGPINRANKSSPLDWDSLNGWNMGHLWCLMTVNANKLLSIYGFFYTLDEKSLPVACRRINKRISNLTPLIETSFDKYALNMCYKADSLEAGGIHRWTKCRPCLWDSRLDRMHLSPHSSNTRRTVRMTEQKEVQWIIHRRTLEGFNKEVLFSWTLKHTWKKRVEKGDVLSREQTLSKKQKSGGVEKAGQSSRNVAWKECKVWGGKGSQDQLRMVWNDLLHVHLTLFLGRGVVRFYIFIHLFFNFHISTELGSSNSYVKWMYTTKTSGWCFISKMCFYNLY